MTWASYELEYGETERDHRCLTCGGWWIYCDCKEEVLTEPQHAPIPEWTDLDRWNMFVSLARIIGDGIDTFRSANVHTYPPDLTPEEWDSILERMAAGFIKVGQDDGFDDDSALIGDSLSLFSKYFLHLWD